MKCLYFAFCLLCVYSISGIILPIQKTDGTMDMSSLLNHIGLMEQTLDNLKLDLTATQKELSATNAKLDATTNELKDVKDDLKNAEIEIAVLKNQLQMKENTGQSGGSQMLTNITGLTSDVFQLKTDLSHLTSDMSNVTTEVSQIKMNISELQNETLNQKQITGATFNRWGRTSCPAYSNIVYKGFTGGTDFKDRASSANILCLPDQPLYANHTTDRHDTNDSNYGAHIYGSEYHTNQDGGPFKSLLEEDMPCVVCESQFRQSVMMVAARNQCYPGWTLEYSGYLMGSAFNHGAGEYICVDGDAEAVPGSDKDEYEHGHVFYAVEGICGSLPCPPYNNAWELTCVVCSK